MKQVDTGGLSFAELREEDMYYVDKSLLIKDILEGGRRGVYLFTRPRRFGKTTNLSMLDAFFNIQYKGNTWFDGLEISKHPEVSEMLFWAVVVPSWCSISQIPKYRTLFSV